VAFGTKINKLIALYFKSEIDNDNFWNDEINQDDHIPLMYLQSFETMLKVKETHKDLAHRLMLTRFMEFLSNPLEINFEFKVNDEKAPVKSMCYSAEGYTFQVIVITRDSFLGCYVAVTSEPYVNRNSAIFIIEFTQPQKVSFTIRLIPHDRRLPQKTKTISNKKFSSTNSDWGFSKVIFDEKLQLINF
jgi:hypothetical protein